MSDLDGKVAIVTGVAGGIGGAIASHFSSLGAVVVGCDVEDERGAEAMSGVGEYAHCDVSSEAEVEALVARVVERRGRLDVQVNNAAIQIGAELVETTEEQLDAILGVNLKGTFFGCKHGIRAMLEQGEGSVVNICSILGLVGDGMLAAYCAAKGGVLGVTRAAAVQYGPRGIRCNAICPGDVDTPLVQEYFEMSADPVAARAEVSAEYPLGRIAAPVEVAKAASFLASEQSSFMTGQPLVLDGGLLADCY